MVLRASVFAEAVLESRYQYYQEDGGRIQVQSNYSLFRFSLGDSVVADGTYLYSTISGASPIGLPPLAAGAGVPVVRLKDERNALTFGLTRQWGEHAVRGGIAYSTESDYVSRSYSLQDTISFNQKNTDVVIGVAYTDDTVGANGSPLKEAKRSYDALLGLSQVLGSGDVVAVNLTLGWREGYLSDPYKLTLFTGPVYDSGELSDVNYEVRRDSRPSHKFEQLLHLQWTHALEWTDASVETSYRFGHNDYGSVSHTARIAFYKKFFGGRVIVGPSFRYYWQSAADFYRAEFEGDSTVNNADGSVTTQPGPNPRYYSSDYRLSEEQTIDLGLQVRWFPSDALKERLSVDAGYDRYLTRGLDGVTSQSAYPDARIMNIGFHYAF